MENLIANPDDWFAHTQELDSTYALLGFMQETFSNDKFNDTFADEAGVKDICFTLIDAFVAEKRFDDFVDFRNLVATKTPQYFAENFHFFDETLLKYALFTDNDALAKQSFEHFIQNPHQDIDCYLPLVRLIALYGKGDWVEAIAAENFQTLEDNDEYFGAPAFDIAKYFWSNITEKAYLNFKQTGVFDTDNWLKKIAEVKLDKFSEEDIEQLVLATTKNMDIENFHKLPQKQQINTLRFLGFNFSQYAYENHQMPFITSGIIWELMFEFWLDSNKKAKNIFNLERSAFDKFCVRQMGFLSPYSCNAYAATWGASYVYAYLLKIGLIDEKLHQTALASIRHNKEPLLNIGNKVWQNGFIKNWAQADSTTAVEHETTLIKTEESFKKIDTFNVKRALENGFDIDEEALNKNLDKLIAEKAHERTSQPQPKFIEVRTTPKIGRNEPCTCGSGKKYKKCCGQ